LQGCWVAPRFPGIPPILAGLRRRRALPLVGQTFGGCSGKSARLSGSPPQLANEASFGPSAAAMGKERGLTLDLAAKIRLHNYFLDGKGLGFNLETFLGIYQ